MIIKDNFVSFCYCSSLISSHKTSERVSAIMQSRFEVCMQQQRNREIQSCSTAHVTVVSLPSPLFQTIVIDLAKRSHFFF